MSLVYRSAKDVGGLTILKSIMEERRWNALLER